MSDNIKELVKRLKEYGHSLRAGLGFKHMPELFNEAADALEAMAGEVAELKQHSRVLRAAEATQASRAEAAEAERDRLKAALSKKLSAKARQKLGDFSESMIAMGDGHSLEMLLNWYDESRKALGGDAS